MWLAVIGRGKDPKKKRASNSQQDTKEGGRERDEQKTFSSLLLPLPNEETKRPDKIFPLPASAFSIAKEKFSLFLFSSSSSFSKRINLRCTFLSLWRSAAERRRRRRQGHILFSFCPLLSPLGPRSCLSCCRCYCANFLSYTKAVGTPMCL